MRVQDEQILCIAAFPVENFGPKAYIGHPLRNRLNLKE
jgi:hypothetical protein